MDDTGDGLTGTWQEGLSIMREPPDYDRTETRFWRQWAKEVPSRLVQRDSSLMKRIET